MNDIHSPEVISSSIRVLPKGCRKFVDIEFLSFMKALEYGLINCKLGFRIYKQNGYEYYEPLNILLAKIENIKEIK